jgi:hypothetical protein
MALTLSPPNFSFSLLYFTHCKLQGPRIRIVPHSSTHVFAKTETMRVKDGFHNGPVILCLKNDVHFDGTLGPVRSAARSHISSDSSAGGFHPFSYHYRFVFPVPSRTCVLTLRITKALAQARPLTVTLLSSLSPRRQQTGQWFLVW